jgi:hypothetical protein
VGAPDPTRALEWHFRTFWTSQIVPEIRRFSLSSPNLNHKSGGCAEKRLQFLGGGTGYPRKHSDIVTADSEILLANLAGNPR